MKPIFTGPLSSALAILKPGKKLAVVAVVAATADPVRKVRRLS